MLLQNEPALAPNLPADNAVLTRYVHRISTYDDIFSFQPRRIAAPRTIAEVSAIIDEAAANRYRIRPMGARLSWAPHIVTQDICLSTENLNRIRNIDLVRKTITVDAGVRLGDITRVLARQGWSLPSLSFLPDVTIGGAVATATHGTSHKWGTLSDFIVSMTLVLPSGKIKVLDLRSPPDELKAARVSPSACWAWPCSLSCRRSTCPGLDLPN
jgi:FAD/FMN-containing dehydrogenase